MPEHAPLDWDAIRDEAAVAHFAAWSLNTAAVQGWDNRETHNQGMTDAVLAVLARHLGLVLPPAATTTPPTREEARSGLGQEGTS